MKRLRLNMILSGVLAMAASPAIVQAQQASFEGLGFINSATSSIARGVSGDGSTVVGDSGGRAFRWQSGTMTDLGSLAGGSLSSGAQDVSGDGSTVVGVSSSTFGSQAFRWTSGTGMVGLGDLPGGTITSNAIAVSADGNTPSHHFFEARSMSYSVERSFHPP